MPPSRFACRRLVFLLLVAVGAGLLALPAEAAKQPFADIVDAAARRHGVDADLVHAVIAVESGYRASAQSPAGAQGLMQLMPGTQRDLGVSDAFDPRQNVDAGVAYLRRLTDEFGTVLALAAYNAGPSAVRRYNGIPPYEETHAYVRAVLGRDRPAADAQAAEKHAPSAYRAHAISEADLAESAPGEPPLQDDHPAADGAARLEPQAPDKEAERDQAADTARLVLHGGAVDADACEPFLNLSSRARLLLCLSATTERLPSTAAVPVERGPAPRPGPVVARHNSSTPAHSDALERRLPPHRVLPAGDARRIAPTEKGGTMGLNGPLGVASASFLDRHLEQRAIGARLSNRERSTMMVGSTFPAA